MVGWSQCPGSGCDPRCHCRPQARLCSSRSAPWVALTSARSTSAWIGSWEWATRRGAQCFEEGSPSRDLPPAARQCLPQPLQKVAPRLQRRQHQIPALLRAMVHAVRRRRSAVHGPRISTLVLAGVYVVPRPDTDLEAHRLTGAAGVSSFDIQPHEALSSCRDDSGTHYRLGNAARRSRRQSSQNMETNQCRWLAH